MATLTIKKVTKNYDQQVTAVKDVSLQIKQGEFVVLVGPSGCGKSTLLRMIAGLEDISSGDIFIDQTRINDRHPKDRDIAMVFQHYALYPHMNVFDNMAFGLKMRKTPKNNIKKLVHEAADVLGLTELLDRKPKELSGGQLQRVAVGRAIVRKPALFLFDEPLSNLDAKMRVAMRTELIKLHKKLDTTILYVTHDQVEAMSMGSRLVVMHNGSVQQIGSPLEIYNSPANMFVAGFIGAPPMNFLPGNIIQKQEKLLFENDFFTLMIPERMKSCLLDSYINNKVILGIRPEHIKVGNNIITDTRVNIISGLVEIIEPLGNEIHLTCNIGVKDFICRVPPDTKLHPGQNIMLQIDEDNIQLYDKLTGNRII